MAFCEIVIDRDLMSRVEQFLGANRANISGAAGDKNVHANSIKKIPDRESSKKPGSARFFHRQSCAADFQLCCIAGFQTRGRRAFSTPANLEIKKPPRA
jgi:hypothetical protein